MLLFKALPKLISALGELVTAGFGSFKDAASDLIGEVADFFVGLVSHTSRSLP